MPAGHVTLAYKVGDSVLRGANCTDARCYLHKAAGMRSGLWQGVPNAFIAAPRRHPFIGFLIHRLGAAANGVYRGNPSPIVSTGPAFLGQAMHEWVRHPAVRAASSSLLGLCVTRCGCPRRGGLRARSQAPKMWQPAGTRHADEDEEQEHAKTRSNDHGSLGRGSARWQHRADEEISSKGHPN